MSQSYFKGHKAEIEYSETYLTNVKLAMKLWNGVLKYFFKEIRAFN